MSNYCSIGKLVATFGWQGELVLTHSLGKKTSLKDVEAIFIEEKKESMMPYFVEATRIKNDQELYLKLEGINSKESAQKLVQKQLWLKEEDFQKYAGKAAPISMLGYHVIHNGADLGPIEEVIEQPHQLLFRIEIQGKEILIPVHSETLVKVDKKKKQVHLALPDGLLDIYL